MGLGLQCRVALQVNCHLAIVSVLAKIFAGADDEEAINLPAVPLREKVSSQNVWRGARARVHLLTATL